MLLAIAIIADILLANILFLAAISKPGSGFMNEVVSVF